MSRLQIVVAADSFKGCLSAPDVCAAIRTGISRISPTTEVILRPMADGGEGTMLVLAHAWGVHPVTVDAQDSRGRPGSAAYIIGGDTAVVELACASGLPKVSDIPLRPLAADTFGTGEVLCAALRAGAREVLLCIGGSASIDGGSGILRALGVRLLDRQGREVPRGGGGLSAIARIDTSGLMAEAKQARWRIAVDVTNPLIGPNGAAAVYGPQKGANTHNIDSLNIGLTHWAKLLNLDPNTPGFGAAGGVPAGLVGVLEATIEPGARLVAEAIGLSEVAAKADLVITGEGHFDKQSFYGKVISEVISASGTTPVIVLAGEVTVPHSYYYPKGITAAFSIAPGPQELTRLIANAASLLHETTASVLGVYRLQPPPENFKSKSDITISS